MKKNSLVILNIGFLLIMLSAIGEEMEINYFTLTSGVAFAAIGAIIFFRTKSEKYKEKEKKI